MSLQETKDHLIQLLADPDNKVIALSGKWGTGKSHLWREVQAASADETTKGALCVSLLHRELHIRIPAPWMPR